MGATANSNSKIILGIDTATRALCVAIGSKEKLLASHFELVDRSHLELSIEVIERVLKESKTSLKDVSAIVVGLGPGSLIGSRVGVETAKTLAQVLDIPLLGAATLDVIASSSNFDGVIVSTIDALKNEIYWAFYEGKERKSDYCLGLPEDLKAAIGKKEVTILGTAIEKYNEIFRSWSKSKIGNSVFPAPEGLISEGFKLLEKGQKSSIYDLEPIYLRGPV